MSIAWRFVESLEEGGRVRERREKRREEERKGSFSEDKGGRRNVGCTVAERVEV